MVQCQIAYPFLTCKGGGLDDNAYLEFKQRLGKKVVQGLYRCHMKPEIERRRMKAPEDLGKRDVSYHIERYDPSSRQGFVKGEKFDRLFLEQVAST